MGEAKRRGTFEERRSKAIKEGRRQRKYTNCKHRRPEDPKNPCRMFGWRPPACPKRCAQHLFDDESWEDRHGSPPTQEEVAERAAKEFRTGVMRQNIHAGGIYAPKKKGTRYV